MSEASAPAYAAGPDLTERSSQTFGLRAAAAGVRVDKGVDHETFADPAVRFVVRSNHDRPVAVRLEDVVPRWLSMNDVGFHPDYGVHNWHKYLDHRVTWTDVLSPGERRETLYGVRLEHPSQLEGFFRPPTIQMVRCLEPTRLE